jgi:hypothetical protein
MQGAALDEQARLMERRLSSTVTGQVAHSAVISPIQLERDSGELGAFAGLGGVVAMCPCPRRDQAARAVGVVPEPR